MCPNCAFANINFNELKDLSQINLYNGKLNGEGIIYCGRKYVLNHMCKCGSCDGNCGLNNGCSCPTCDLILGYNIYLNNNMICGRCKNALLIKITLIELKNIDNGYETGFVCNKCRLHYHNSFCQIYHCFKCNFDICQICAYNTIKGKKLSFPYLPKINFVNPEENKNEKMEIKEEKREEFKKENKEELKEKNKVEDKEEKDDENEDNMKCSICLDNNKCMLFLPCKHVSCCEKCAENLDSCPLCRNPIQSKIKIYL